MILGTIAAVLTTPAMQGQTLQFANQAFYLAAKDIDNAKLENDYLPAGETESDWSQKLVLTRFPTAKDVRAFADHLCQAVNTQRPGAEAAVSQFGADCYVSYAVASSAGKGQLSMVHRILIDPQGGIRTYVLAQRPSPSKPSDDRIPIDRDQCIRALGMLSPIIQMVRN